MSLETKKCNLCSLTISIDLEYCEKCIVNLQVQEDMENAESFDELWSIHMDWINGKRVGFPYNSYYTLDRLDGSKQFIDMLRYISHKLKIVTVDSQPSIDVIVNNICDSSEVIHYEVKQNNGEIEKVKAKDIYVPPNMSRYENKKLNYKFRPYINGYIQFSNLRKIFEYKQTELIIIGTLPTNYCEFSYEYQDEHGLIEMRKKNTYIKNDTNNKHERPHIHLSRYYFTDDRIDEYGVTTTYRNNSDDECDIDDENWQTKLETEEDWNEENIICEISIIHDKFGVDENEFIRLVKDLCDNCLV